MHDKINVTLTSLVKADQTSVLLGHWNPVLFKLCQYNMGLLLFVCLVCKLYYW